MAPAGIENRLGAHGHVEACCVAGLGFPQPFAMLMLSPAIAGQRDDEAGRAAITASLATLREQVNAQLDPHERLDFLADTSPEAFRKVLVAAIENSRKVVQEAKLKFE